MPFLKIAYGIAAHIYPYGISLLDHWDSAGWLVRVGAVPVGRGSAGIVVTSN